MRTPLLFSAYGSLKATSGALALLASREASGQALDGIALGAHWLAALAAVAMPLAALVWRYRRAMSLKEPRLASLHALADEAFVRLLDQGFRRYGYRVSAAGAAARELGVSLVLAKGGRNFLVHSGARNEEQVGERSIRELTTALDRERSAGGLIVTCGQFSETARALAAEDSIGLISGGALLELVQSRAEDRSGGTARRERREPYLAVSLAEMPECGRCGGPMVEASPGQDSAGQRVCSPSRCVGGR